jgi:ketosteroid isomerase-like protein
MKRRVPISLLAIALACAAVPSAARAASADQAQVQVLYAQFAREFRRKDVDGIMSHYVHDTTLFVFDVTPPREHIGWDDYRKDWKAFFRLFRGAPAFDIRELQIVTSGDVAYTRSIQHVRGTLMNKHKADFVVRVTDVLRRANGKWFIVQEHVSVPVNILTGNADLQSRP